MSNFKGKNAKQPVPDKSTEQLMDQFANTMIEAAGELVTRASEETYTHHDLGVLIAGYNINGNPYQLQLVLTGNPDQFMEKGEITELETKK